MESEISNNTAPQTPLNNAEETFGSQYGDLLDESNPYLQTNQPTAPTNSQGEPETCSLCNEPDPLFEPNGANLEPVARLTCLHSFHLKCINISLKNDPGCPRCRQPIYFGEDDGKQLLPEDEYMIEKLFRNLSKEPQDFSLLPGNLVVETETPTTTPEMIFVGLHDKIVQAEKILEGKTREVSRAEYEVLDSYYPLGEVLVKKLAEFRTSHPLQTARILLNTEIKRQIPSDMSRNVFNKKKRSAINIYKIFSTEGLGRDDIRRIRKFSPSTFGRFKDKTMEVILERIRTTFSRPGGLENLLDDLDLNEEGDLMLTD